MADPAAQTDPDLGATLMGIDPLVGTVIDGRYAVERILGEGGMGLVYAARHVVLNKPLAVKVLRAEVSNHPQVIARFRQEAQSATAIGNQHIIDVVDFGTLPDGATYFVMEFLDGSPLTKVIEHDAPLPLPRFVHVAKQLCDALGAAHGAGIIHRDLKPDNIFLVRRGNETDFVKVLDFGIAKVGGSSSKLTQAGQVFGTPHYMSPEQCQGAAVDPRADIYALGIILFEVATGRLPFEADTLVGLLTAHLSDPAPPPSSVRPDCPPALDAIILRCLAKQPSDRYASCADLLADLDAFAQGHAIAAPSRVSGIVESSSRVSGGLPKAVSVPPPASTSNGSRAVMMVGGLFGALGLAAVGVGGYALRAHHSSASAPAVVAAPVPPVVPTVGGPAAPEAIGSAPPAAASATIRMLSVPEGAEVLANGQLIGTTPLDVPRPAPGERLALTLRSPGFEDHSVTISSGTLASELHLELQPARTRAVPRTSSAGANAPAHSPAETTQAPTRPRRPSSEVINPWGN